MNLKDVTLVTMKDGHYITTPEFLSSDCIYEVYGEELHFGTLSEALDGHEPCTWVESIFIRPENIGYVNEGAQGEYYNITELTAEHLTRIYMKNGACKIEIQEPFLMEDAEPGDIKFEPIYLNGKVIIHL